MMGINDPITFEYREKQGRWIVLQGRETFYDEENYRYEFDTFDDALEWANENLPLHLIEVNPDQISIKREDNQIVMEI